MKKYKIINKSDLTKEEIRSLIDIVSNIIKPSKNYKTPINWNNKTYYINIKCGMLHNKFIIKQKLKDDRK